MLRIGPEVEEEQRRRLEKVRPSATRDAVERALARRARRRRRPDGQPDARAARRGPDAYATLGEIVDALADVFGRWVESPRI